MYAATPNEDTVEFFSIMGLAIKYSQIAVSVIRFCVLCAFESGHLVYQRDVPGTSRERAAQTDIHRCGTSERIVSSKMHFTRTVLAAAERPAVEEDDGAR